MYVPVVLDTDEEPHEGRTLVLEEEAGDSFPDAIAVCRHEDRISSNYSPFPVSNSKIMPDSKRTCD